MSARATVWWGGYPQIIHSDGYPEEIIGMVKQYWNKAKELCRDREDLIELVAIGMVARDDYITDSDFYDTSNCDYKYDISFRNRVLSFDSESIDLDRNLEDIAFEFVLKGSEIVDGEELARRWFKEVNR